LVYELLTEPDTYSVTGSYEIITEKYKNPATAINFEAGVAWYNYEFSKSSESHVFAVMQTSNRLNLNTATSLGMKAYINLYTHLIQQTPTPF